MRPRAAGNPGSMVRPPRLGKHQGARDTSISRAGSQTPRESPIRGIGEPHRQIGEDGLAVSGAPDALPMEIGPIEIGSRHSQQTSVIGLTKPPGAGLRRRAPRRQQDGRCEGEHQDREASHAGPPAGAGPTVAGGPPAAGASSVSAPLSASRAPGEHVDHALPAGDDDLGHLPVAALAVLPGAHREPALDQHRAALAHHCFDRLDRGPVDHDPVPFGALLGLPVLAFPALRGGQAERRRAVAAPHGAELRIAPGAAEQCHPVHVQHRCFLRSFSSSGLVLRVHGLPPPRPRVCRVVVERDFVDAQMRAVVRHPRGRGGKAEAPGDPPALVEEEGAAVAAARGRAAGPPAARSSMACPRRGSLRAPRRFRRRGCRR